MLVVVDILIDYDRNSYIIEVTDEGAFHEIQVFKVADNT